MVAMLETAERTNNDYFRSFLPAVNSPPVPHRDVSAAAASAYRPYNEEYAAVPRRVDRAVQPEPDVERTKKEKKWSLGKLFRRKKKEDESVSSSESDEGVSTRSPNKKKWKKKKKTPAVNNFDHIVIRDSRRAQSLAKSKIREATDDGVLSDPSAGFINYRAKAQEIYGASKESLSLRDDISNKSGKSVLDTPSRKSRKGRLKARVEALRNSMRGDSSSDEESLKSSNSSSIVRFRSDDSLMRSRDSSLNKRSRSARNERYIKRLSRDEENQLNKEAELLQQGYTKAEVEMLTRTPTSQSSGYGTCKRDQNNKIKPEHIYTNDNNTRRPMKSESVSSFPSTTQSYPSSINFNAKVNNEHINYSIQCPVNNINRESLYANNNRERSVSHQYESPENVMCVKFPLGNVANVKKEEKAPPVPPPRDMQRKVATPLSMYYENNPVVTDRMGNNQNNQNVTYGVPNNDFDRIMRRSQERSVSHSFNGLRRPISNSEDHIAVQNNEYPHNFPYRNEQPRRPASVSAEPNHYGLFMNSPWRRAGGHANVVKPEAVQLKHDYLYYADQSPRSRRPISIKNGQNPYEHQYLSDSQTSQNIAESVYRRPRNASAEFWKKIDDAERQRRQQHIYANSRSSSDFPNYPIQRTTSSTEQNKLGQNSVDIQNKNRSSFRAASVDTTDGAKVWKATTEYKRSLTEESPKSDVSPTLKTHVRHKSDTYTPSVNQLPSDDEKSSERRKSTNLDDALNELEAIYNSLGLGDEDLLDRAERRELMTPKFNDHFNDWNGNDDEVQLRSQPTTPLRRISRRSTLPDKLQDDMAFRRMNSLTKEKPNFKETQAQISYMLASPVYVPYASDDDKRSERSEPDIVHDDVMYRNITQTNNRLKTIDPQPPFGIPVGPVSPAPQSDYLHATPETKVRSRFIPRRSPDLVSDDLAYRSLRKDGRHSSLFNGDDYNGIINNNGYSEFPLTKESAASLKKKRAVRSLSANIFTMIQKEIDDALNMSKIATLQKTNSNSDVMKRLRDTFDKNDNQPEHYPRNKVKQRHNTVSLFVNNIHAPTHHFAKDDSFIHCDDKHLAKPPSCDKSKSSSPSNKSPQVSKRSSKDEFQQVLSMLAQEAMDTSNKLGVALAELDKNRNNNEKKSDIQAKITDSRLNFLNGLTNKLLDVSTPEVKHVKIHSEVFEKKEDKMANAVNSDSKAKKTEDSLLVISDQLHKVEDQLKHSFEKELNFDDESLKLSNYISKAEEQLKAQESTAVIPETKLKPDIIPLKVQNDSINIENTPEVATIDQTPKIPVINSLNPFLNSDDKIKEINEINAFKELKDGISDLIAGITQVNEKLFAPKQSQVDKKCADSVRVTGITEASEKLNQVSQNVSFKPEVPNRASVNLSIYENDLDLKKDADSTEYNSSEELATIFKLDSNTISQNFDNQITDNHTESENKIREDLSSPKMVQNMNQHLRRLSVDQTDDIPSQSNSLPNNVVPWRTKRQNSSQKENRGDNTQQKRDWRDSGTLMLACTYTLMISQHLADLDWLMLFGLLLAMITIIAMLII
ncbi:extracellular matrix-binding protein ebh isoform X3 [Manduca sexta]|uniref:Uncharacterized protein n=1 Tax=Manduca sexta TaxID=7130 RepID=A0A921YVK1_MANSE|nr:extracellular matrix-binding protein ebh isoform X3 [Manduca sexta]KAG6446578.1 hypothetical protein O3G_MSEX004528 [Manduca sexta]